MVQNVYYAREVEINLINLVANPCKKLHEHEEEANSSNVHMFMYVSTGQCRVYRNTRRESVKNTGRGGKNVKVFRTKAVHKLNGNDNIISAIDSSAREKKIESLTEGKIEYTIN